MSSEDVAKTVAKKLQFYLDTQRREDAFDLSGPYHPESHPPALRPGSSLAYDGLHDRSLKHYYRNKKIKQQLQSMKTPDNLTGREKQIRKRIDTTMQEYNYKPNSMSPYAVPLIQPKTNSPTPEKYYKPKRGSRRRKNHPHMVVGKAPRLPRRAPDQRVPEKERERLVNMATKLIVATETIALPRNRKAGKEIQADSTGRLPSVSDTQIERRASSASDPGPRIAPRPPDFQNSARRKKKPSKWEDSNSGGDSLDSTLDSIRSQMRHINIDMRGDSYLISDEGKHKSPLINKKRTATSPDPKQRPKSAGDLGSPNPDDFDYEDDFYDHIPEDSSPVSSPRTAWKGDSPVQSFASSTQTVETKGTQTLSETPEIGNHNIYQPSDASHLRSSDKIERPTSASTGTQVEDIFTQEKPKRREMETRVVSYEVFVVTGDKLGAGTSSDVKICMFGAAGDCGERPLLRSRTNKNPFERKQVDIFLVDSVYLGDLRIVRIGHNGTALGSGWFLDRIVVREGEEATRAFEFNCDRWLSARDDDGQIVRDLPLSRIISGDEVPESANARSSRIFFKYRPDSAGSADSGKIKFRPLSASNAKQNGGKLEKESGRNSDNSKEVANAQNKKATKKKSKEKEMEKEIGTIISSEPEAETTKTEDSEYLITPGSDSTENVEKVDKEKDYQQGTTQSNKENEATLESSPADDDEADKADKDEADDSKSSSDSHSDDDSNRSSDRSETSSVSGTESDSSDSDDDRSKQSEESDNEEAIERVEKDTSKKEELNDEERKKSLQNEYMAGFLAGVQASKSEPHVEDEIKYDSAVTTGPNIHQASEDGDFERIKELISEIPELKSKPDERGWTPLHIVAGFGHLEILKWLSVNGVNLTEETPTGFTAIHLAAMNGHVKCIMVLGAMGCPLSCRDVDENTPLHLASMNGHVECVKWLLANRAHSQVYDKSGRTPLDLAEEYQHEECAKILKLLEREMKRKDSVLTMLRHPGGADEGSAESDPHSSKGADSGLGGAESGEGGWISDAEDEVIGRGDRPTSGKTRQNSFRAAKARKKSKQDEKATDELEEKRKVYEKQQKKMQRRESSFLDSIRQDIDDKSDNDF